MCLLCLYRGRTLEWVKTFVKVTIIGGPILQFISVLINSSNNLDSHVVFSFFIAGIGGIAFCYLTKFFYIYFLRRFLVQLFPFSWGHKKSFFTGKSSRTLKEILLKIDEGLPTDSEVLQEFQDNAECFVNDLRTGIEKQVSISGTRLVCIFVGSVAEGYGFPHTCKKIPESLRALHTDIDIMFCFDPFQSKKASFSGKGNILIHPYISESEGFLGFARLELTTCGNVISSKRILKEAEYAVSCTKATNFPRSGVCCSKNVVPFGAGLHYGIKGPAIYINIGEAAFFDVTLCFKCCEWPPTSDWPTRQRCWPSQEHVTRIVSHGCHLVAKPAPSDEELTSWRFSFSVAEVELAKLVPNTARKCFLALKVILKDHLQPVANISSYHLKTIFLNTLEKTAMELWVDENIEECFLLLIKELHDALVSRQCIHYWFRTINLFGSFFHPERISILIKKLEKVAENPAPFIFDDGCCCLYPCCTRLHLYDFPNPDGRQRNIDKQDEVIRVEPGMKNVLERNVAVPNHSLSQNTEGAVGEQSVRVTIHEGCEGDEINNGYDNDGVGDGKDGDCNEERRPMLSHFSNLPKYGAISNSSS